MSKYTKFLTPQNAALILIDYQPAMVFGVQSHDRMLIAHNVLILAKSAKLFKIPTVLSTVAKDSFSGELAPEITSVFPGQTIIDRTSINAWLNKDFRSAVESTDRKKRQNRLMVYKSGFQSGLWENMLLKQGQIKGVLWRAHGRG